MVIPLSPLERCVDDVAEFRSAWGERFLLIRGDDPTGFSDVLAIADVDRIISTAARPPTIRMVREGVPVEARHYCTPLRLGGRSLDDVVDPRKVSDHIRHGATLVLQSLHRTTPSVASFVSTLQCELGHPVQANAYLTPADASGLAPHADEHDVIVLQLHGSKRWSIDGTDEFDLGSGDSMYIPAGVRHQACTTDTASLHLTLGIIRVTYRQVLERMLAQGPASLDRPLPVGFQTDPDNCRQAVVCGIASMINDVRQHLAEVDVESVAASETRRRRREPFSDGRLASLLACDDLTSDTVLRWSAPVPLGRGVDAPWCGLDTIDVPDSSRVSIHLGDRVMTVPAVALAAIRLLSAGDAVRVDDLPGLDAPSRVVLARRLVDETACVIDPGHAAR